jgi:hypothetical protein
MPASRYCTPHYTFAGGTNGKIGKARRVKNQKSNNLVPNASFQIGYNRSYSNVGTHFEFSRALSTPRCGAVSVIL